MPLNKSFRQFVDGYPSQAAAARALNRSRVTVNRVYHGHLPVSLQVARQIERLTANRITASALLGLQSHQGIMQESDDG